MRKYVIGIIAALFVLSSAQATEFTQDEYNTPEYGVEFDENMYDAPENPLYDYTEGIQLRGEPPITPPGYVPVPGGLLLMLGFAGVYMLQRKVVSRKVKSCK